MRPLGMGMLALALLPGCDTASMTLAIGFPSELSFLLTDTVEVDVVDASDCTEGLTVVAGEPGKILRHASGSACAARAGEVVVSSIPHRTVAVVATAFNPAASTTQPILRGCRMITITDSPPAALDVTLDYGDPYFPYESTVTASGGPGCTSADARCAESCTP